MQPQLNTVWCIDIVSCKNFHHHDSQRLPDRSEIGVAVGFPPSFWIWPLFGAVRVAISDDTSRMRFSMLFNALGASLALIFLLPLMKSKGAQCIHMCCHSTFSKHAVSTPLERSYCKKCKHWLALHRTRFSHSNCGGVN
jgi:hypothetical protein